MFRTVTHRILSGVIEGFYGPPWSDAERAELFGWMADWKLDTYVHAPKDDLHHRVLWRESYSGAGADRLRALIQACQGRGLEFVYAIGPGLDLRYGSETDTACLRSRARQMLALGCTDFALLFDDVPDRLGEADRERWANLAAAQSHVANGFFEWLRDSGSGGRLLFCPTAYCGRMAAAGLGGPRYLETLGRDLLPGIDIFWTGPEIVSSQITIAHAKEIQAVLRRKAVIWDNLHANDYDGRRFFCGPYSGRPEALRDEVGGLLINPNCELSLNYVPLRTFSTYLQASATYDPRAAWLDAVTEWHDRFETTDGPLPFAELTLFGDGFYLPCEDGAGAQALYTTLRRLLGRPPAEWGADVAACQQGIRRLRSFCERLPMLKDRALFHALSRRVWELREELDLLDRFLAANAAREAGDPIPVRSDFHLPGTFRGGFVARLQTLLVQRADGAFVPSADASATAAAPQRVERSVAP